MALGDPKLGSTPKGRGLAASIVRIYAADDSVVGAGFLASPVHVVTCSHVVAEALGVARDLLEAPSGEVRLDFPFLTGASARARVATWQPAQAAESGDIAVLTLAAAAPPGALPAPLLPASACAGRDFEVFGFPDASDAGRWSYGVVRGSLPDGWVQVEENDGRGYRVQPGYSGAPVWIGPGAIGMIVGAERDASARVGFLIPSELIQSACPALAVRHRAAAEFAGLLDGLDIAARAAVGGFELFLREYVGRPGEPVPFGGREADLTSLDSWLADVETPYALLVAPAGRGKSALIARWCVDVAAQERASVVLVPVSIRFQPRPRRHTLALSRRSAAPSHGSVWRTTDDLASVARRDPFHTRGGLGRTVFRYRQLSTASTRRRVGSLPKPCCSRTNPGEA